MDLYISYYKHFDLACACEFDKWQKNLRLNLEHVEFLEVFRCHSYVSLSNKGKTCFWLFNKILLCFCKSVFGCKQDNMNPPTPLGDYLLDLYFEIFLEYFEQFFLIKKILKFFCTLLCYYLHGKFAKNMSFSKKFKSVCKPFYCLKTLVTMLTKCFWVFFIH